MRIIAILLLLASSAAAQDRFGAARWYQNSLNNSYSAAYGGAYGYGYYAPRYQPPMYRSYYVDPYQSMMLEWEVRGIRRSLEDDAFSRRYLRRY